MPADEIIRQMKHILDNVDYIWEVAILGGEILSYKELPKVVKFLADTKKIGKILFITNSTLIIPDEVCDALNNTNIIVWLDQYREYSREVDAIVDKLSKYNIKFRIQPVTVWLNFGLLEEKHYTDEKNLKQIFECCYLRDCVMLFENKLYRCGRQFVLENNKLEVSNPDSVIDISTIHNRKEMEKALKKFYSVDYIDACGWCNKNMYEEHLVPGEQLEDYG